MSTTPSHTARTLVFTGEIKDKPNSISVNDIINNDETTAISDYKAQFTEKLPSSFNNDDISNDDDNIRLYLFNVF